MFCQKCGTNLPENATECMTCGAKVTPSQPRPQQPRPQQNGNQSNPRPSYVEQFNSEPRIPERFRPLGAWTYFALNLLFCVPIVGFIFLIIFSCSQANINRRNYARSFFCIYAIVGIILLIVLLAGGFASLS